jgi:spore coat polysaccharide biosynthesis protein SpsF (cytidylyltransferase family)
MSSRRLPGKVLAEVAGEPMLALLLARLGRAERVGEIVVATSIEPIDDPVAELAEAIGVAVHRGPRDDVLGRFIGALDGRDGPVVRITADCPFVDPGIVDAVVELFASTPGCAYASNVVHRVHPDGLDVEVVDADALRAVALETDAASDREHVTPAVRADPERFPAAHLSGDPAHAGPAHAGLNWTVDEGADLTFVRRLADVLGDARSTARFLEILAAVRSDPVLSAEPGRAWPVGTVERHV